MKYTRIVLVNKYKITNFTGWLQSIAYCEKDCIGWSTVSKRSKQTTSTFSKTDMPKERKFPEIFRNFSQNHVRDFLLTFKKSLL